VYYTASLHSRLLLSENEPWKVRKGNGKKYKMIISSVEAGLKINYIKTLTNTYLKVKGATGTFRSLDLALKNHRKVGRIGEGAPLQQDGGQKHPLKVTFR